MRCDRRRAQLRNGMEGAQAKALCRMSVNRGATIDVKPEETVVPPGRRVGSPRLIASGSAAPRQPVPWPGDRRLRIRIFCRRTCRAVSSGSKPGPVSQWTHGPGRLVDHAGNAGERPGSPRVRIHSSRKCRSINSSTALENLAVAICPNSLMTSSIGRQSRCPRSQSFATCLDGAVPSAPSLSHRTSSSLSASRFRTHRTQTWCQM